MFSCLFHLYIRLKTNVLSIFINSFEKMLVVCNMNNFILFTVYSITLFFLHEAVSLKCRSGNQQMDTQFQKVLKTCRKGFKAVNTEDSISMEDNSSESNSTPEDMYDKNFYYRKDDRPSYNQSTNDQKYRNFNKNGDMNIYSSDHLIKENRNFRNVKHIRKINNRTSWNSRDSRNRKSDFNNGDTNNGNIYFNNNTNQEQACIIQCFFNELNAVDQKGFPKKELVIPLMIQNIQDSELKDFVEESIIECFHYLESSKQEKCEFSQNLLMCLAEKGQQKCEDWEN